MPRPKSARKAPDLPEPTQEEGDDLEPLPEDEQDSKPVVDDPEGEADLIADVQLRVIDTLPQYSGNPRLVEVACKRCIAECEDTPDTDTLFELVRDRLSPKQQDVQDTAQAVPQSVQERRLPAQYHFQVLKPQKVPFEYCGENGAPDRRKILAAIEAKTGQGLSVPHIPGVMISKRVSHDEDDLPPDIEIPSTGIGGFKM